MFSAVISTAARELVRVKGNKPVEKERKPSISVAFRAVSGSLPQDYFGFFIRILSSQPCTVIL